MNQYGHLHWPQRVDVHPLPTSRAPWVQEGMLFPVKPKVHSCMWVQLSLTLCDPLCPWNFPGKNTGVGWHFLLKGIFPMQGSNQHLLHWQAESLSLSHQRKASLIQIPNSLNNTSGACNIFVYFFFLIVRAQGKTKYIMWFWEESYPTG